MITCQHAHQLFDRYLDGELSASLQTELHAHRLNCSACQGELALLEACGDVIAMDRCEPQVSVSFTDRVVLAQRGRHAVRPRRWRRMLWLAGSPMAAAASIAFTIAVISPPARAPQRPTAIRGIQEATPEGFRPASTNQSPDALRALASTPQMEPNKFVDSVDSFLAPIVERSKSTIDGTRRGAEELQLLMQLGVSRTNGDLIARWRAVQQEKAAPAGSRELDPAAEPHYLTDPPADSEDIEAPSSEEQPEPI